MLNILINVNKLYLQIVSYIDGKTKPMQFSFDQDSILHLFQVFNYSSV